MPKVWLITGSLRGVGRTIVEAALAAGDKALATAREPVRLQDLGHRYGSRIRTVQHDVRNASAAATAVQVALDAIDHIDVVVNANRSADPSVEDFSLESFRVPVETNLFDFAYLIDAILAILQQQRSGHIIEVSPEGSFIPALSLSGYHISKDAVEDFTLELAHKVTPLGIKVTIVETGYAPSARLESSLPAGSGPYSWTVTGTAKRVWAHESQEANHPRSVAGLILGIAGMAEPPLRLLAGPECALPASDPSQSLSALETKWRN
jgi:NAD(P)-dependent dehydrogenase (short-subunit alcohol dehydrogenase family)